MTDAVTSQPTEASPAALAVAGPDMPAVAAAGPKHRSISADSFRRLTARLKSPAVPQNIVAQPDMPPPAPIMASVPEIAAFRAVEELAVPPLVEEQALSDVIISEEHAREEPAFAETFLEHAVVDETAEDAAEEENAVAADDAPLAALPAFAPLADYRPEPLTDVPAAEAAESESLEVLHSSDLVAAVLVQLPQFSPPAAMHRADEEFDAELAALEPASATPAGDVDDEVPGPVERDLVAFAEPAADMARPADEPVELPDSASVEPMPVEADAEVLDLEAAGPEAAVTTVGAEPEVSQASSLHKPAAGPVEPDQPEAKARSSEMAERVVDAMIKTISTAIYAKPSAAERAAFLREMAALMDEAANESEGRTAQAAETKDIAPPPSAGGMPLAKAVKPAVKVELQPAPEPPPPLSFPKVEPAPVVEDPFAQAPPRIREPRPQETAIADEESGELALTLLDMMSGGTGSLPHERTLAADTLLRILPRIPVKQLTTVVERVSIMETPPALLVAKLIRDTRPEIIGPLLERCSQISDQDLMNAAPEGDTAKLRMIARRRILSTVLSDFLIATGDPGVLLTLIRNPGAALSHDAFFRLAEFASRHHALLAPLTTRADLPPPVAFELFWHVPPELRRFIFSRFLTDSETLNRILRITLSTHAETGDEQTETKFPSREALDEAMESASGFRLAEAAGKLAELARIAQDTALRILSDREGEPISVLLKALGCQRTRFEEFLDLLRRGEDGLIRADRKPEELQAIFDSLSFNKARILLTYWDWFVRKSGPYSPHH